MNRNILKALTWDAIYQVLDNWVFRILSVLVLIPVLFTFAFGFRQDEIVLLFGLKSWSYDGLIKMFTDASPMSMSGVDGQTLVINAFVEVVVNQLLGSLGIMLCIAATAFFVPRMVEKGAADLLFHKPVSRFTLYLSRYFAGLFFIAVVSSLLVIGLYLGFLLSSGYNDPGILFNALTLMYIFGLVHTVSMLVGVITRSTVASILLSMIFFTVNGCVHTIWGSFQARNAVEQEAIAQRLSESVDDEDQDDAAAEEAAEMLEEDEDALFVRMFKGGITTLHYLLPKTGDADVMARKLRNATITKPFQDEDSLVTLFRMPEGAERLESGLESLRPSEVPAEEYGEPLLGLAFPEQDASFVLSKRELRSQEIKVGSRTRVRKESATRAGKALEDLLEDQELTGLDRSGLRFGSNTDGLAAAAVQVFWTGEADQGERTRAVRRCEGVGDDWFFSLTLDGPGGELSEARVTELYELVDRSMALDNNPTKKANWYDDQLSFDAEWKFNIFFSVGSSLGFAAVMLLLGAWRLKRIDF